jgi:hypothetical protein
MLTKSQAVNSWDAKKKENLLQFVTGTSRIPVNGFRELHGSDGPLRFTIEMTGPVDHLPTSSPSLNRLHLPPYNSYGDLDMNLSLAIELGVCFSDDVSGCISQQERRPQQQQRDSVGHAAGGSASAPHRVSTPQPQLQAQPVYSRQSPSPSGRRLSLINMFVRGSVMIKRARSMNILSKTARSQTMNELSSSPRAQIINTLPASVLA